MAGFKTILPDAFTGAGLANKILYDDAMMNPGSLILLDGAHSLGKLTATVGSQTPNIAYSTAAALCGGVQNTLSPVLTQGGAAAGFGKELTTKGGLHIATRQATITANDGYWLTLPALIEAYLLANPSHAMFMSMWSNITRIGQAPLVGNAYEMASLNNTTSGTANFRSMMGAKDWSTSANRSGSRRSAGLNGAGNQIMNDGSNITTGTVTDYQPHMIFWGPVGSWSSLSTNPQNLPSWVLYRFYFEDLTVSGRTYAQADADDYAAYNIAFGAGGKFYGDTYTAPATLAGA